MSFATKMYTRPVLINALRQLGASNYKDLNTFVNAFSPRAGARSAKIAALGQFVTRSQLQSLFNNSGSLNAKKSLISVVKNA